MQFVWSMSPDLGKLQSFYEKHRLYKMKKNMYIQDQGVKSEEFFIAAVFSDLFSCLTTKDIPFYMK